VLPAVLNTTHRRDTLRARRKAHVPGAAAVAAAGGGPPPPRPRPPPPPRPM
jgi:hypothetical protein